MAVYIDNLETEFLPLNFNWITSNLLPKYDESNDTFVEPYLPHHPIGLIHLAGLDDVRNDKKVLLGITDLKGKTHNLSLRFEKKY